MIWPLIRRSQRGPDTISILYGMIVAQARLPCFYRDYAVADTVNGRFELVLLHLSMALGRLFAEPGLRRLGQALFDRFCRDMDDNLREMGVGDLSVPKKMRHIGDAFNGRSQVYQAALKTGEEQALAAAIARNVYDGSTADEAPSRRLAAYIRRAHDELAAQPAAALSVGKLHFPDPSAKVLG